MKHLTKAALLSLTLVFSACGADPSIMEGHSSQDHMSAGGVEISSAYIMPPFSGRTTSAAFFTVQNKGADTRLLSASTPIAETTEIHTHLEENGVMKMRRIEGVDLPKGSTVEFKPGSYHLMMFNTALEEGQKDAPLTLTYSNGETVTLIVDIQRDDDEKDDSAMDHSGH